MPVRLSFSLVVRAGVPRLCWAKPLTLAQHLPCLRSHVPFVQLSTACESLPTHFYKLVTARCSSAPVLAELLRGVSASLISAWSLQLRQSSLYPVSSLKPSNQFISFLHAKSRPLSGFLHLFTFQQHLAHQHPPRFRWVQSPEFPSLLGWSFSLLTSSAYHLYGGDPKGLSSAHVNSWELQSHMSAAPGCSRHPTTCVKSN